MNHKTFLVFGCLHEPVASQAYCRWLIDTVADRQPAVVVCNGDLIDMEALSKYEPTSNRTLKDEYDKVSSFMERLNDVIPAESQRVYLLGNHEERLLRPQNKRFQELLDFRVHCPALKDWKILDYAYHPKSVYQLGQVTVAHGFSTSEIGARTEAVKLGRVNGLYVYSHIHRGFGPRQQVWSKLPMPYWTANTGCGIDAGPETYFRTWDTSGWNRGCIVGWAAERPNYNKPCWEAEFLEHSRVWDR